VSGFIPEVRSRVSKLKYSVSNTSVHDGQAREKIINLEARV
jgi:hypothetical protein